MNAFGLSQCLDERHADHEWACYLFAWLAADLAGEEWPTSIDLQAGFRGLHCLDDMHWREFWGPWFRHMQVCSIDGVMLDLIATSLRRLQTLVGSLGPEIDEQLHQWLNSEDGSHVGE